MVAGSHSTPACWFILPNGANRSPDAAWLQPERWDAASVAIGENEWKKAAEFYLEAKPYQPDDEVARANEALAYQFLGQRERAFSIAYDLKDIYPHPRGFLWC
jgi:hypothetical protein